MRAPVCSQVSTRVIQFIFALSKIFANVAKENNTYTCSVGG